MSTEKFEFFKLCAQEQYYRPGSRWVFVYNNKIGNDHIPQKAREIYGEKAGAEEWYTEFLRGKFQYFSLLLKDKRSADLEINKIFGNEASLWESVVADWRKQAGKEKQAYIQRISQIPRDIVISCWYNDLQEFQDWAALCEKSNRVEPVFQPLSIKTEGIALSSRVARIYETLSLKFVDMLGRWNSNQQEYIREFLEMVQGEFPCDICDYLEVQGEHITLYSTTVDFRAMAGKLGGHKTIQQLQDELAREESYLKGQGISGCILLWPGQYYPWFHVGSDNLARDLRKEIGKQEVYEELYHDFLKAGKGKIHNFWMFPIIVEKEVRAAFRVVNRRNESGDSLLPRGWPENDRLELCELARRFSTLWGTVQSLPMIKRPSFASVVKQWDAFISDLLMHLELGWVSEIFVSQLVTHLQSVVFQKMETRSIGCSIVVVHRAALRAFLKTFDEFERIKSEKPVRLPDLIQYYDETPPSEAAFVFNEKGEFVEAIKLVQPTSLAEHSIATTTDRWDKTVAFLVEKEQQNILIYRKGRAVAEHYFRERAGRGDWYSRFYGLLLRKICSVAPHIDEAILRRIFREACRLSSRGLGAKILIADPDEIAKVFVPDKEKREGRDINEAIHRMTSNGFIETVKGDGSVTMTPDGIIQKAGIFLKPKTAVKLSEELSALLAARGSGGRHGSAAEECCACANALIFVISQNRGISVLHGGSAILWDC